MLRVSPRIEIPDSEFEFQASRSSGPGGQNVNKVNSKAQLRWNVVQSPSLPDDVRQRFLTRFGSRVLDNGELLIVSQKSRDYPKNVADCLEKLREMLTSCLHAPRRRVKTKPTRGSVERRLSAKKQQSQRKQQRRPGRGDD